MNVKKENDLSVETCPLKSEGGHLPVSFDPASERFLPCRSNEELEAALGALLHRPRTEIEVAGGIVRHGGW